MKTLMNQKIKLFKLSKMKVLICNIYLNLSILMIDLLQFAADFTSLDEEKDQLLELGSYIATIQKNYHYFV